MTAGKGTGKEAVRQNCDERIERKEGSLKVTRLVQPVNGVL